MIKRVKKLPNYFGTLALLLSVATILAVSMSKTESFMLLNSFHHKWLDIFFKAATNLGDGIFSILVVLILIFSGKKKKALTVLIAYLTSGLATQTLKRIFHMPRPTAFFEQHSIHYQGFVEGVERYHSNAFPSGHTTSAFALATAMVMIFKKKKISFLCISFAVITGYSRIYLAQHFLQDVIFGALTGTLFALLSYYQVYDQKILKILKRIKMRRRQNAIRKHALSNQTT